ncbi:MAG TPA: hypothetical protein VGI21_08715 [Streptosporangiaceae bacterium]
MDGNRLQADQCGTADVDLSDGRHPADVLHVPADEFAAFVQRVKAGAYDHLAAADGREG